MKCYKTFRYDLRNGILRNACFLAVPVFSLLLCVRCRLLLCACGQEGTWIAYIIFFFRGMETVSRLSLADGFRIPILWILVMIIPLFISLNYPFQNMKTIGQQLILRSVSRVRWWLTKCIWNVVCTLVYFLLLYSTSAAFCLCHGVPLSIKSTLEIIQLLLGDVDVASADAFLAGGRMFFSVLLLPFATAAALCMLEMLMSLLIRPVYSFLICIALLVASSYATTPLLIGNYANLMRNGAFIYSGLSCTKGIILCLAVLFLSAAAGSLAFRNYNILPDYKEL